MQAHRPSPGQKPAGSHWEFQRGSILLEVILALALFVAAAAIIGAGLSRSVDEAEQLRAQAHAHDLAVSVLSELQLGIRPLSTQGPDPLPPPYQDWTCQTTVEPVEVGTLDPTLISMPLLRAEVVIRHDNPAVVDHLTQLIPARMTNAFDANPTPPAPNQSGSPDSPLPAESP